jgi:hypothetical protein
MRWYSKSEIFEERFVYRMAFKYMMIQAIEQ